MWKDGAWIDWEIKSADELNSRFSVPAQEFRAPQHERIASSLNERGMTRERERGL